VAKITGKEGLKFTGQVGVKFNMSFPSLKLVALSAQDAAVAPRLLGM